MFQLQTPRRLQYSIAMLIVGLFAAHAIFVPPANADESLRPNVVLIMADDMGYGDLGFHGNPLIETPNLDAMAARSSIIQQFYVSPVCAPTRACLMTGRYNYRTRVVDTWIGRAMMDPGEVTIAEVLGDHGYATGIFGKWHLGDCYPMRPMDQGFTESLIHRGGGIGQPSDPPGGEGKYTDPILFHNGEPKQMKGFCTDVYYDAAMQFITKSTEEKKPFFVYLPDNCPHGPFHDVPPQDYAHYKEKNLANDQFPQTTGHKLPPRAKVDQRARIFAMVTNIDRNVGRLFEKLKSLNTLYNTIVIFMIDNGPNGRRYVRGMKGNKTMVHEGGVRSPFFIHWPAGLKQHREVAGPFAHIDVMPSLLEACGAKPPEGLQLDGVSFLPSLAKADAPQSRSAPLVIQSHRGDQPAKYHNFMIRDGDWKLLHGSGFGQESFAGEPKFELFHLKHDPLELKNLAAAEPEQVARLQRAYDRWFADVSATRPDNYAPPRIVIGTEHETLTTLTRQDWRHAQGRPWAANSLGIWLLESPAARKYSLACRFSDGKQPETGTVFVDERPLATAKLDAGARQWNLAQLSLPKGKFQLRIELRTGDTVRGVHQADVRLLNAE